MSVTCSCASVIEHLPATCRGHALSAMLQRDERARFEGVWPRWTATVPRDAQGVRVSKTLSDWLRQQDSDMGVPSINRSSSG